MKIASIFLFIVAIFFFVSGYYAFDVFSKKTEIPQLRSATIQLAAVDSEGIGILIPLLIEMKPGTGKILMNIDNPSFIIDTQDSMRIAVKEAARITGYELNTIDILFSIKTEVSVVGGPSAGAAMTAATVSVLSDKPLNKSVAITGTIEEGGTIGQVGAVFEKAKAAKEAGITLFLVPVGQSVVEEPVENCTEKSGHGWKQKQCTITTNIVNISKEIGIEVKEVATINDALNYLLER